eukprot:61382-Pyramimonas_sp.AAC.1
MHRIVSHVQCPNVVITPCPAGQQVLVVLVVLQLVELRARASWASGASKPRSVSRPSGAMAL